jgi:membrane-associated protease RseP (regulator of RpoE activity)
MMSRLKVLAPRYENFTYSVNRNPCAVFIGIYTTDRAMSGEGLRITGVIEDTPAKESGLQPGDVILSLDGQPINTYSELLVERNKHQPGDPFQLNILRDGEYLQIDATFKSCEKKQDVLVPVKEKVELIKEETPSAQREDPARPSDATLQLETFDAYPNPTFGPLNVLFEAEALPTTVRIMDVTGKAVYSNTLNQFSGYFSEQIDLFGNPPGTYILTVQQDNRLISKKITLLPRA